MKLNLNKGKHFAFKILWLAAKHAFFMSIFIFLVAAALGLSIYYYENYSIEKAEINYSEAKTSFDQKAYDVLAGYWQKNSERFSQSDAKKYPDPFMLTGNKK